MGESVPFIKYLVSMGLKACAEHWNYMHQFPTAFNKYHFTYLKYYLFPVSSLAVLKGNGSSGGQTDIAACLGSLHFSSSLKLMTLWQNNMATSGMRQLKEIHSDNYVDV